VRRSEQRKSLRDKLRDELRARMPALRALRPSDAPKLAPAQPPGRRSNRVILGVDSHDRPFGIPDESRVRHCQVMGVPGSGKSLAMVHLCKQDILNGAGLISMDPHGRHDQSAFQLTIRWLVASGVAERRKIHIFDPSSASVCGFNPAHCPDDCDPSVVAANMSEAVARGWGDEDTTESPTLRRGLRAVFTAIAELRLTLLEVPMLLDPHDPHGIRAWALQTLKDETARRYLERLEFLSNDPRLAQTADIETIGIRNRLEEFTSSKAIRRVFGQYQGIDLQSILDNGEILLINLAGSNHVSETEGDLLGRLFFRAIMFHAKRRKNTRPVMVWADEAHRYLSGDIPNALEELRKNSVSISLCHQNVSQLGKPGDRIREAILTTPQTKIIFALNNIAEATLMAPEVVKLPHEKVVEALIKPTVIGHEIRLMKTASTGNGVTETASTGQTITNTKSESIGRTIGGSESTGESRAESHAVTKGTAHSVADGVTDSVATTRSRSTTIGSSDTVSDTESEGGGTGAGGSHADSDGWNQNNDRGVSFSNTTEPFTQRWPDRTDSTGTSNGRNGGASDSQNWSENESWSNSHGEAHTDSYSETEGIAVTEGRAESRVVTDTDSESETNGTTIGTSKSRGTNWATSNQAGSSTGIGTTTGKSTGRSTTRTNGVAESLAPIMRDLPTAVHSLQTITHMAAEAINELPIGTAIVKTRISGRVESAIVRIPLLVDPKEKYPGYAKAYLLERSPLALPIMEADRLIADRHEWIKAHGAKLIAPKPAADTPKSFRVSGERWVKNPQRKGEKPPEEA
jgi:hypothetical protein